MKIHEYASQGNCERVRKELQKGVPVDARDAGDFTPLACAARSPQADDEMLRLLIAAGANVNATVDESKHSPVSLAACSGDLSKIKRLLDAGADVNLVSPMGYTALVHAVYALCATDGLVTVIDFLAKNGALLDCETDYGESPLNVALRFNRFDAVRYLRDAGVDLSPLQWTPLLKAVALGTCEDVQQLLVGKKGLDDRDRFGRTAWLWAACVGDLKKAELLLSAGVDLNERDRMGDTALAISSATGATEMVRWLLDLGASIEAMNELGQTALMVAAQAGQTNCVELLLRAGAVANRTDQFNKTALSLAANEPIIRLLIEAGADQGDISIEMKRMLIGLEDGETLKVSQSEYLAGRDRRFGSSNPEVMNVPFWNEMVRAGVPAYRARQQFGDTDRITKPVWCFSRFGTSFTELPDGRFIQIGGEHEDFYDPDFCIYNDVVIHERSGRFQIMGYPKYVFPPTDFHSATFVRGSIYVIGRVGYHGERAFGTTPVYRLNCQTWQMEPVPTAGSNPGWIFEHKASIEGTNALIIVGGKVCKEVDGQEQIVANTDQFRLDLSSMNWSRL